VRLLIPLVPRSMPTGYWFITDFSDYACSQAYHIQITTDEICHLWLRWSLTTPQKHPRQRRLRGVEVKGDVYYCFVAVNDIEQAEAGDTLVHTFTIPDWPACQTRWFYFHGTYDDIPSPSTSAIFGRHLDYSTHTWGIRITNTYDESDYLSPTLRVCPANCPTVYRAGRWQREIEKLGGGMRFRDLPLPKCAEITLATITFTSMRPYLYVPVHTQFGVEDDPNPPSFAGISFAAWLHRRNSRRAVTDWDNVPPWPQDSEHVSPSLIACFHYAVNLPGYEKGNAIVIFWDDIAQRTPWSPLRARLAYTATSDPTKSPLLLLTYNSWYAEAVS